MFRQMSRVLSVFGLLSALVVATGCSEYPECDTDEDCTEWAQDDDPAVSAQAKLTPYCVNKQCQQCRGDTDCPRGNRCTANRCEKIPGWCESNAECASPQICINNMCKLECEQNSDCSSGNKCEQNRCVPDVECTTDEDCGSGEACKGGKCVPSMRQEGCKLETVYFDFDMFNIRSDAASTLQSNADCLKKNSSWNVTIEGHCDERGTEEYNLSLGEKRANAAKRYLTDLGIDGSRVKTVTYGETRPADPGHDEDAWAKNRRGEFIRR